MNSLRPLFSVLPGSVFLLAFASVTRATDPASLVGDAQHGKTLFVQNCALCHSTELGPNRQPINGQGPSLVGLLGRRAASVSNFNYTNALSHSGMVWNSASLDRFLANPTAAVPGTSMPIMTPNASDRRDIIAFLSTLAAAPAFSSAAEQSLASPSSASGQLDPGSWHYDVPGLAHAIDLTKLPAPYSTHSSGNSPRVVDRPTGAQPSVPAGFAIHALLSDLSGPRLVRVAPNGDIFVAETREGRVRVVRTTPGTDTVAENRVFADALRGPFGIAFYPTGTEPQWIYVANNNSVVRFPYRSGDLKARGESETIVPQLCYSGGGHSTRDLAFSLDGRHLYISVGSGSNVAEGMSKKSPAEIQAWEKEHGRGAAWDAETNRADILVTTPEKGEVHTYATGIRNGVGLAIDPATGQLWVSTNERDGLGDNLVPDYITHVQEGGFYGWPWYYMGNHEDPRLAGERPDLAGQAIVPDVPVQPHSASLEMTFYPVGNSGASTFPSDYQGDIFAAFHGSWNRSTRTGYKVVRVRRKNGVPTGEYTDFATSFVVDDNRVWGRPVGVAVARDGALLVTDDGSGTLWRVSVAK